QAGVLAGPADPRARRPAALEDGAGVRIPEGARAGQGVLADEALQPAQPVAHDMVVVLARGVARDVAEPPIACRLARGIVAQGDAHDRAQVAQDPGGIAAALAVARLGEPGHAAVASGGEPGLEVRARLERLD